MPIGFVRFLRSKPEQATHPVSRDERGKFIESSPYGKKNVSTRLLKEDELKLLEQSEKLGLSPAEIARIAIAEWLKNNG